MARISRARNVTVTEGIPVTFGGAFWVRSLRIRARAEHQSRDRQSKYSHPAKRGERGGRMCAGLPDHFSIQRVDELTSFGALEDLGHWP
jgi:hypothetical protein